MPCRQRVATLETATRQLKKLQKKNREKFNSFNFSRRWMPLMFDGKELLETSCITVQLTFSVEREDIIVVK